MITVGAMALEEPIQDRPDVGCVTLREEAGDRALPIMMLRSQLAAIADESKRRPGAIRLVCSDCRAGTSFEMIPGGDVVRVRDGESSAEFRLLHLPGW